MPIISGTAGRCGLVAQRRPGGQPERRAVEAAVVVAQQRGHQAGGLLQRLHRLALVDPDGVEPRAAGESEEGAPVGGEVEGGDLSGDLVRGAT